MSALALGNFHLFDDPRTLVKVAGTDVNHYGSGDWDGTSRISHRGRSTLRAAADQQARLLVRRNDGYRARFWSSPDYEELCIAGATPGQLHGTTGWH